MRTYQMGQTYICDREAAEALQELEELDKQIESIRRKWKLFNRLAIVSAICGMILSIIMAPVDVYFHRYAWACSLAFTFFVNATVFTICNSQRILMNRREAVAM